MTETNTTIPQTDVSATTEASSRKAERERQKEQQKAEKLRKLAEKQAKRLAEAAVASEKPKETKSKQAQLSKYVEQTPKGEKKILGPLDDPRYSAYNPQIVESAWYDWWEKEGFFKPEFDTNGDCKEKGYFVIPIPPPNVTGALHCGHAVGTALQDLLIRWHRMKGFTTLYLPGCDHASISTQAVIENMLWRKEGKTRHDLGREQFLERALEWKEEYHGKITQALRRLGGSLDWSREAFTMDENNTAAVMETFVRLHDEGYIYRSNRLVNWCVKLNTSISNLEVDNEDLKGRTLLDVPGYERKVEFGVITHFYYPIEGSTTMIEVATTRPETILGDTGIAVHPNDSRYKSFVGKYAKHPFVDRLLPIIADEYVDPEFGTGAVKITPAHDPNDYALGQRHNLNFINILNDDGTFNHNAGKFAGQKRFDVRFSIVEELKSLGLFVKKEENPMKVPLCKKTKDVIEPLMKPQWWMRMSELAGAAIDVVKTGEIKIRPESAEKSYFRWLENINDWCLSRQLWWGHRIPAYFVEIEGEPTDDTAEDRWVTGRNEAEARDKASKKFPGKSFRLLQDPDVLDTWFSSALWPFSTLGWPKATPDFEKLFPTSVLETGWDILFFWIARMIMLSLKLTDKVPFHEVYCHSLVRDSEGRKMSKSLGNVIDPLDVMEGITLQELNDKLIQGNLDPKELATATRYQKTAFPRGIPECGTDAMRFTLIQYTTGGGDIALDMNVMAANRRFCNKLYQATKYVLGKMGDDFTPRETSKSTGKESLAERWILHKLSEAGRDINAALAAREFSRSAQIVYQYWYEQMCDVFIENSKAILQNAPPEEKRSAIDTLYTALEGGLTLIHPFMPFISEELWQRLPRRPNDKTVSIMNAAYPEDNADFNDVKSATDYELILSCSKGIRSLASEYGIKEGGKAMIYCSNLSQYQVARAEINSILSLSGRSIISIEVLNSEDSTPSGCAVHMVSATTTVFLDVKGHVAIDELIRKTRAKQEKATEIAGKQLARVTAEGWSEKVSDAVRTAEMSRLAEAEAEMQNFTASLSQFETLSLKTDA